MCIYIKRSSCYNIYVLQKLLNKKPYLAWYIRNKEVISDQNALEHILSYGNWQDFLEAEKLLGIEKIKILFNDIKSKKRVNLRPRTINYFDKYFARYA